jgi:cob(I)alamin adenosyltransferase
MKVYTKTGDQGETSLFGGKRVKKFHARINAYGTTDELLSYVGLIRDQDISEHYKKVLIEIQDRLFTIGAELAADPDKPNLKKPDLVSADILFLEQEIDAMDSELEPMKQFILPGGHQTVSFCHVCRCICRRAERLIIELAETEDINPDIIMYVNRLSDYLFVLARKLTLDLNAEEIPWIPRI